MVTAPPGQSRLSKGQTGVLNDDCREQRMSATRLVHDEPAHDQDHQTTKTVGTIRTPRTTRTARPARPARTA